MSSSKEKRNKDLDNTTYPLKHQHLDNDMDRDFSFKEIDLILSPILNLIKLTMIILTIMMIKLIGIKIKIKQKIKDHQF